MEQLARPQFSDQRIEVKEGRGGRGDENENEKRCLLDSQEAGSSSIDL